VDPVSLIVAALVAGAAAALKDTAGQAVKDAYTGLKTLLRRKTADAPAVEVAVQQHEEDPDVWEQPLRQLLTKAGAGQDAEIVEVATRLLALADPAGKYTVTVSGGQGVVVGDGNSVRMAFGPERDDG
jgi:hypothetical protein